MQGPRLYRFFNYELPVYLPAPSGGWSPDVTPWELPLSEASQLDNFLIRPGKIVMRGPLVVSADLSTWYPLNLAGAAMTNTGQLLGRKSTSGGQVDPWNAPLLTPQASSLASGLTSALWIVGSAASPITVTADQIPGPRSINFYGEIYGISYDSAGSVVQDANSTYHMKPLSLYNLTKASPTSATGTATTFANNGGGGTTPWNTTPPPSVTVPSGPSAAAQLLLCEGFGFALPSTAVVQGIQLTVNWAISGSVGYGQSEAYNAFAYKGGTLQPTTRQAAPISVPAGSSSWSYSVGGSTDLWGTTWAYSDINAANFGFSLANFAPVAGTYTVTSVTVQVWYTVSSPTISVLSNAPHGAFDLIGYQSRLWLLGGIDTPGAGTTHDPLALYFTNPIAAGGGSATADWQDPVSGLTNKIVMDGDTSDYGVGLATVRNGLIILRRASIYLLKGSTTANYTLIPISREVGCVDARSIVETDRGVYFMSLEGLMFTNGVSVVNVSGALTYTLQQAIEVEQNSVLTGNSGYVTCRRTSHGQILVSIGVSGVSGPAGSYTPIFTAMYDPAASKGGAWVRITSQLWSNDGSQLSGNNYAGQIYEYSSPKRLITIGDRYVTTFEDQAARSTFLDPTSGLYDQLPSGAKPYLAIPAVWRTPIPAITTANKRVIALAHRYFIDYNFAGGNLQSTNGWQLVPLDVDSAEIDTPQITPIGTLTRAGFGATPATTAWVSGTTPNSTATMLRMNRDWFAEIRDCTFVVWWSDVAQAAQPSQTIAEIYGLGLEFQRSRDLRS